MNTVYPSRVDAWLATVLVAAPLFAVGLGVFTLSRSVGAGIVGIMSGLVVGLAIAALTIPCVYTLDDDSLKIRSGMLEDEVPLRSVRAVEKSSSLWSAPALSLRRVKITLNDGSRVISPKDRDGFMADLNARVERLRGR